MRRTVLLMLVLAAACGGAPETDTAEGAASPSAASSAGDAEGTPISVPPVPKAQYYLLERSGSAARPTILTKFVGPGMTSYSKLEVDCGSRTYRYLGSGNTRAEVENSTPQRSLRAIVVGNVEDYLVRAACAPS